MCFLLSSPKPIFIFFPYAFLSFLEINIKYFLIFIMEDIKLIKQTKVTKCSNLAWVGQTLFLIRLQMVVIKWSLTCIRELLFQGIHGKQFASNPVLFIQCILGIIYFRNVFHKIVRSSFPPVCPMQTKQKSIRRQLKNDINVFSRSHRRPGVVWEWRRTGQVGRRTKALSFSLTLIIILAQLDLNPKSH